MTLVVADSEGGGTIISLTAHQHLDDLLRTGLAALYGEPAPKPGDYDLLIGGVPVSELSLTLAAAGVEDGDEVVLVPRA